MVTDERIISFVLYLFAFILLLIILIETIDDMRKEKRRTRK